MLFTDSSGLLFEFTVDDLNTIPAILGIVESLFRLAETPVEKQVLNDFIKFLNFFDSTRYLGKEELKTILMKVENIINFLEKRTGWPFHYEKDFQIQRIMFY